ncbi:hypothetical protein [Paraburkholderia sp. BR14320]|uniref:hypothetical protein n=1 Tax=unclassified Paraburkholderia TaxID=2615204 RepID=UPI0034CE53CA
MTILELPRPPLDEHDANGRSRLLPYLTVKILEEMNDTFPAEYVPHLLAAVDAIKEK